MFLVITFKNKSPLQIATLKLTQVRGSYRISLFCMYNAYVQICVYISDIYFFLNVTYLTKLIYGERFFLLFYLYIKHYLIYMF
jgi:hypothetical protein